MGATTSDEIKETFRRQNYFAMKHGDTLCLHFGRIVPDFASEYFDPTTTPECVFRPKDFDVEAVWKATLREDEDVDFDGNKGWFQKKEDHKVCVLSEADPADEENMRDM